MKPRLLDAYCAEGGASEGYARAGFEVFGVDLFEQHSRKRYPFVSYQADAVAFVEKYGRRFDVIAASPPCQHASAGTRAQDRSKYPRLIEPTRDALKATGRPYVIENVAGSALVDPLILCGTMFGLRALDDDGTRLEMWRHRHFESNVPLRAPVGGCRHHAYSEHVAGSYGGARRDRDEARFERHGGYVPVETGAATATRHRLDDGARDAPSDPARLLVVDRRAAASRVGGGGVNTGWRAPSWPKPPVPAPAEPRLRDLIEAVETFVCGGLTRDQLIAALNRARG